MSSRYSTMSFFLMWRKTTATAEHEQATTGVEVLLVGLHVLGQLLDALGQDGDLNLGVTGINRGEYRTGRSAPPCALWKQSLFHLSFRVACGRLYSPRTGKPPVERTSKVEVPTGGYVTTSGARLRIITNPT